MMGKFGWSLPPGCGRLPGEEPEGPCILCGEAVDDCKCEPCQHVSTAQQNGKTVLVKCEVQGCLEHMNFAKLVQLLDLREHQVWGLTQELMKRQKAAMVKCPRCGAELTPDIRQEGPLWCEHCKKHLDEIEQEGYEDAS